MKALHTAWPAVAFTLAMWAWALGFLAAIGPGLR